MPQPQARRTRRDPRARTERHRRSEQPRSNARTLAFLCTATFLIFFQAFMVAPLIPRLADDLDASVQHIGLIVPA